MSDQATPPVPPTPEALAAAKEVLRAASVPYYDGPPIPPVSDAERIRNLMASNAQLRDALASMSGRVQAAGGDVDTLTDELNSIADAQEHRDERVLTTYHYDLIRSQSLALLGATTRAGAIAASLAVFLPLVTPAANRALWKASKDAAEAIGGAFDGPTQGEPFDLMKFVASPEGSMLIALALDWYHKATAAKAPASGAVTGATPTASVPATPAAPSPDPVAIASEIARREQDAFEAGIRYAMANSPRPSDPIVPDAPQTPANDAAINDPLNPIGDAPSPDDIR